MGNTSKNGGRIVLKIIFNLLLLVLVTNSSGCAAPSRTADMKEDSITCQEVVAEVTNTEKIVEYQCSDKFYGSLYELDKKLLIIEESIGGIKKYQLQLVNDHLNMVKNAEQQNIEKYEGIFDVMRQMKSELIKGREDTKKAKEQVSILINNHSILLEKKYENLSEQHAALRKQVDKNVNQENGTYSIVLTFIGALLGAVFGYFISQYFAKKSAIKLDELPKKLVAEQEIDSLRKVAPLLVNCAVWLLTRARKSQSNKPNSSENSKK